MLNLHKYFHWYYHLKGNKALFNIGSGIVICCFLLIAQPFGIGQKQDTILILKILGAIVIISATTTLNFYFLDFLFTRVFSIRLDNLRHDFWLLVFKIIVVVHITLVIRGFLCKWQCIGTYEYFQSYFAFFLIIGLVYLLYIFYARSKYYHSMLAVGNLSHFDLILNGGGKESIEINAGTLVYLQSDDNYVDLVIVGEDNKPQKKSIRATLSSLEKQLQSSSQFVRIHRSYIINTKFYSSFSKGKNEVELTFAEKVVTLPVSRKYKPSIAQLFTHHK